MKKTTKPSDIDQLTGLFQIFFFFPPPPPPPLTTLNLKNNSHK